jgi:hypothetical protein
VQLVEKSVTRTMGARPWFLLICLGVAAAGGLLQARAQIDSNGMLDLSGEGYHMPCLQCNGLWMSIRRVLFHNQNSDISGKVTT